MHVRESKRERESGDVEDDNCEVERKGRNELRSAPVILDSLVSVFSVYPQPPSLVTLIIMRVIYILMSSVLPVWLCGIARRYFTGLSEVSATSPVEEQEG